MSFISRCIHKLIHTNLSNESALCWCCAGAGAGAGVGPICLFHWFHKSE